MLNCFKETYIHYDSGLHGKSNLSHVVAVRGEDCRGREPHLFVKILLEHWGSRDPGKLRKGLWSRVHLGHHWYQDAISQADFAHVKVSAHGICSVCTKLGLTEVSGPQASYRHPGRDPSNFKMLCERIPFQKGQVLLGARPFPSFSHSYYPLSSEQSNCMLLTGVAYLRPVVRHKIHLQGFTCFEFIDNVREFGRFHNQKENLYH